MSSRVSPTIEEEPMNEDDMTSRERAVICDALAYVAQHKGGTTAELAEMWEIQRRLGCELPKTKRWVSYGGKRHRPHGAGAGAWSGKGGPNQSE